MTGANGQANTHCLKVSGKVAGISISAVAQLYDLLDRMVDTPRILALSTSQRYALAGKVAELPDEQPRVIERLASHIATSMVESSALNALCLLEACRELVPGFAQKIPEGRLEQAARLSLHERVQSAVLLGQKPSEWEKAEKQPAQPAIVLLSGQEPQEGPLDVLGDTVTTALGSIDSGIDGTADDLVEKGLVRTLGDSMCDTVDIMTDFVGDAVGGIAGSVKDALDWVSSDTLGAGPAPAPLAPPRQHSTHRVAVVVTELFGHERSIGIGLENRIVTKFTRSEAESLGWRIGDCIVGVGARLVPTQESMLVAIGDAKETLKADGSPIRFLVERLGPRPPR